ncbi:MAG TPA: transaldolase family protein, partial [Bacteroidales bacterium]|nr:transaldolase family protein [Bacteroidales bacterium]
RAYNLTGTKFWINNVTPDEARLAIEAGAVGCTQNPSYTWKILSHPEASRGANKILDELLQEITDNNEVECILQRKLVKGISDIFMGVWNSTNGEHGYVSIQGDPIHEEDPEVIINEGRKNREMNPNIMIKIPATEAGLKAMEVLIAENTPVNATEVMGISQALDVCRMYHKLSLETGNKPKIYYSLITGIYDEYLHKSVEKQGIEIDPDILYMAGLIIAKKVYSMTRALYPEVGFIGGGVRGLHHFTEMVGADVCITMNWPGQAEELIRQDMPVVPRFFNPAPDRYIDELLVKVPEFRKAYMTDGLSVEEYEYFGPVEYFRSMFISAWNNVLKHIEDRRKLIK